jgi:3-hydroxy-9,10-secoandrosta-1,3,5(10)-triene-9,17-dione monooxygenase reductase component
MSRRCAPSPPVQFRRHGNALAVRRQSGQFPETDLLNDRFRATLGHFASGVVVITGMASGSPMGFTCQSFFSLSLSPPLIAIAPGKSSTSWPSIATSQAFCANVLSADQQDLCRTFAWSGSDKFSDVSWTPAVTGSPRLEGAMAWIDCRIKESHDAGDHHLVVGSVVALGNADGKRPLLYFRGQFNSLGRRLPGA